MLIDLCGIAYGAAMGQKKVKKAKKAKKKKEGSFQNESPLPPKYCKFCPAGNVLAVAVSSGRLSFGHNRGENAESGPVNETTVVDLFDRTDARIGALGFTGHAEADTVCFQFSQSCHFFRSQLHAIDVGAVTGEGGGNLTRPVQLDAADFKLQAKLLFEFVRRPFCTDLCPA